MMLSVCVLSYNHERYVAEALAGIANQRVDFPMEVIVGEDCSTDRTAAILREFAKTYPGEFRVLSRQPNLGCSRNLADAFLQCRGKYIALLESDDSWTHPDKLQRQVDFLE